MKQNWKVLGLASLRLLCTVAGFCTLSFLGTISAEAAPRVAYAEFTGPDYRWGVNEFSIRIAKLPNLIIFGPGYAGLKTGSVKLPLTGGHGCATFATSSLTKMHFCVTATRMSDGTYSITYYERRKDKDTQLFDARFSLYIDNNSCSISNASTNYSMNGRTRPPNDFSIQKCSFYD